MQAGDRVVLYTDGVTEGRRGDDLYGEARLKAAILPASSARQLTDRILDDVLEFQAGNAHDDVVAAIGVPEPEN